MLYKLTDKDGRTFGITQWGPGVVHSGTGEGGLCGPGWIHAYEHPLLAVLLNPIRADFDTPRLWEAEGDVGLRDHGLKVGCQTLTTLREIPLPVVSTAQRVRFAILCAREVCPDQVSWHEWAEAWLSGADRSAWAAGRAEEWAARAAGRAEEWAARAAGRAEEWAARAAGRAEEWAAAEAEAAKAAKAAWEAAWAKKVGAAAWAEAAAAAAEAAAAEAELPLAKLAEQAIAEEV